MSNKFIRVGCLLLISILLYCSINYCILINHTRKVSSSIELSIRENHTEKKVALEKFIEEPNMNSFRRVNSAFTKDWQLDHHYLHINYNRLKFSEKKLFDQFLTDGTDPFYRHLAWIREHEEIEAFRKECIVILQALKNVESILSDEDSSGIRRVIKYKAEFGKKLMDELPEVFAKEW